MLGAALTIAGWLGGPAFALGQDPLEAPRRSVAANPDDHRATCRYGWALVAANRHAEARDALARPVEALRGRTGPRARRLLSACLYNRGRAFEGVGARGDAVRDYVESLVHRDNRVVRSRLASLVEGWTEEMNPLVALAVEASGVHLFQREVDARETRTDDGTHWNLVALSPGGSANGRAAAYAGAMVCGRPQQAEIDEVSYDNATYLEVESARPMRIGEVPAVVVTLVGGGDDNCQGMDGMQEYTHRAIAVVFVDECQIRVARFLTDHHDCGGDRGIRVRFDRRGSVLLSHPRWDTPQSRAGSHSLRELAR